MKKNLEKIFSDDKIPIEEQDISKVSIPDIFKASSPGILKGTVSPGMTIKISNIFKKLNET